MYLKTIARQNLESNPELLRTTLDDALNQLLPDARRVLLLPPDLTRRHSGAGEIAAYCYARITAQGRSCDVLPALGTHVAMSPSECAEMFPGIPYERIRIHDWRNGVEQIGEVPGSFLSELSGGIFTSPVPVQIDRTLLDPQYDLILSIGQVVPHEVVGMANYTKNIVVGCGGSEFINISHMLGAAYGLERMMGRDHSPVRKLFDYVEQTMLRQLPLCYILTVCSGPVCGLFIGTERDAFEQAVRLSQARNIQLLDKPVSKVVAWMDPGEYHSTWLANKAVYRSRMAIADGGELVVLAGGVCRFGEDETIDTLIRKYGYTGRERILAQWRANEDLRANASAAAHLIHGSSDERFTITYCTSELGENAIRGVGYNWQSYEAALAYYHPETLQPGWNEIHGDRFYFIPQPGLGLWADRTRFEEAQA